MAHPHFSIYNTPAFLDALASLGLMIDPDKLINRLEIDSPVLPQVTQNGMSLKMECHSEWNVTQNEMSLKMECHSKWIGTQNGMSIKMECHLKWNVIQNGMSLKMECHSN